MPDSIPSILAGQGCCVINGPVLWSVKQECKKWLFMFMSGGRVTTAKRDPNMLGECSFPPLHQAGYLDVLRCLYEKLGIFLASI